VFLTFIILFAFRWLYLVQSGALILHQNKFKPTSVEPSPSPNVMSLAWVISVPINGETLYDVRVFVFILGVESSLYFLKPLTKEITSEIRGCGWN